MRINDTAWRGVFPAVTTQFHDDGRLDLDGTAAHLEKLIQAGVHGLIMLGTVGENCSLEYREKLDVLRATVAHVDGACRCSPASPSARRRWPAASPPTHKRRASTA